MKYLIMIYHTQSALDTWASLPAERRAEGMRAHEALVAALTASGELVLSEALAPPDEAREVRVLDGAVTVTDGPFAEVKEFLAGFYLVECASMDRALACAALIPDAAAGRIEVRPVLTPEGTRR
ncbi:YciI family protein [Actinocorallia longicatena]|uniref:YciI family protein n=1 Tax=Actinocorallia longicatena TaxID=111803 RepID=A0ABP6QIH7_9ACTN